MCSLSCSRSRPRRSLQKLRAFIENEGCRGELVPFVRPPALTIEEIPCGAIRTRGEERTGRRPSAMSPKRLSDYAGDGFGIPPGEAHIERMAVSTSRFDLRFVDCLETVSEVSRGLGRPLKCCVSSSNSRTFLELCM